MPLQHAALRPCLGARLPSVLELLEAIFLGVVQGLTEFLPVSSSGHLLLSQYFLGMDQERFGLSFDAAIHTGTVLAVVWFFWGDLLAMARAFLRSLPRPDFSDTEVRMAYLILVATVPADRLLLRGLLRHAGALPLGGRLQPRLRRSAVPGG
jgi:undecaprenyl pyrophosphate phosphatase UppP